MPDTATLWNSATNRGDWLLAGPVLATGNDLETAILLSLFTDRMAAADDTIPDGSGNPRGWWGDPNFGSRLWLLQRAKQTQETLQNAYDYIVEALQWLIDDGVVGSFDVYVEWTQTGMLGAQVIAYKPNGVSSTTAYTWAWNGLN